jgi:DEAD/DEAH box helicase domain-containing protein
MQTTSFWLHFPGEFLNRFPDLSPTDKQNGVVGLGNVLRTVGSLLLMCDPRDLGIAITEDIGQGIQAFEPDLFVYDAYPGGIGLSAPLFKLTPKLLHGAAEVLQSCPCESGCPACVGPIGEVGERGKEAALRLLAELCSNHDLAHMARPHEPR